MHTLKIFISSTMTELYNERVALRRELEQHNHEVLWFEGFGARPESPQQAYLKAVNEADLYLGIFWNQHSSATEEEYREALRLNKPCLIYVKNFNVQRDPALTKLLNEIGHRSVYKSFANAIELGDLAASDIQHWLVERAKSTATRISTIVDHTTPPAISVPRRLPRWLPLSVIAAGLVILLVTLIFLRASRISEDMIQVPPGKTVFGSTLDEQKALIARYHWDIQPADLDDLPRSEIANLPGFWIDRYEVSNSEYAQCPTSTCNPPTYPEGMPTPTSFHYGDPQYVNFPVVLITWENAANYCKYVGKRLPTEIEWEKAARGEEGRIWVWGNEWRDQATNVNKLFRDAFAKGYFASDESIYHVRDLAGNVREWVASSFENKPGYHVARGGSWASPPYGARGASRQIMEPDEIRNQTIGFRCAKDQ